MSWSRPSFLGCSAKIAWLTRAGSAGSRIRSAARRKARHTSRRRRLIRPAGIANGDRGPDGGVAQRSDDDGADWSHEGAESSCRTRVQPRSQRHTFRQAQAKARSLMTVWIYVDTTKQGQRQGSAHGVRKIQTPRKLGSRKPPFTPLLTVRSR